MYNILFVQPTLHPNFEGLLEGLISNKYNVKYLSMSEPFRDVDIDIDFEIINSGINQGSSKLSKKSKLIKQTAKIMGRLNSDQVKLKLNQFRPDFIIGRHFHLSTLELMQISDDYKIPFLIYTQSHKYNKSPEPVMRFFNFIYSQKTGSNLTYINPTFEGFNSESEFMYLPLSIPRRFMKSSFNHNNSHLLRVSCILDYRARKRLFEFLQIIESLSTEISLELHLIGRVRSDSIDVYSEKINKMIQKLQKLGYLKIHGPSTRDSVFEILRICDIHVMPSINEPFGFSNIEAMSQATIPIIHCTNGSRHTVTHKKNGFLFEDEAELKNILSYLGDNNDVVTKLKQEARLYALNNHNPSYSVDLFNIALSKSRF